MYDHVLRKPKSLLLLPMARRLTVPPNALTGWGLGLGLVAAACCALGWFRAALLFWAANRIADGLDGEVARVQDRQTDLGGYFDILADLLIYAFIPLGIAFHLDSSPVWIATGIMLASFYLNVGSWMYLSSILEKAGQGARMWGENTSVTMPRGLIEGGETVLFFTLFLLYPERAAGLFWAFSVLTFLGAFLRVRWAARALPGLTRT